MHFPRTRRAPPSVRCAFDQSTRQSPRRIMDDSDSSGLSSAPPTDDEKPLAPIFTKMAKGKKAAPRKKKAPVTPPTPPSPPRPKRSPSPPHEESLADNPDVAVCRAHPRRVQKRPGTHANGELTSSLSCSDPASAMHSRPNYPTSVLKILRRVSPNLLPRSKSKS